MSPENQALIDDLAVEIARLALDEQRAKTRKALADADAAEALSDAMRREIDRVKKSGRSP
jgi:hypothetical protein